MAAGAIVLAELVAHGTSWAMAELYFHTASLASPAAGGRGKLRGMTNVASVLKNEISRVARKELRSETAALKKAVSTYRSEIAALKRRTQALEQALRRLSRAGTRAQAPEADDAQEPSSKLRFSAKGLASQRRRLGLSAHDCGLLVGASGQSVYNWESGKAKPRNGQLPAIAMLRTMGKKEAADKLAALKSPA